MSVGQLILYRTEDGQAEIQLRAEGDTLWLTQSEMAELFDTSKQNVSLHVRNILKDGELHEAAVIKKSLTTAVDGKNYRVKWYGLPMILAVGYRVRSPRGTQFRQWATAHLEEYLLKGFVMGDERLKEPGGWDYFDVSRTRRPLRDATSPIVIGIGNPWRGDDGIGHAVVHALQDTPGLTTATTSGEPAELMDLWQGHDPVILVDAIMTGTAPGTIHRLDAAEPLPRPARYSSHGIGLAEAIELARALDALPASLVIYGIEPATLEDGARLSPELVDRIAETAGKIRAELVKK